MPVSEMVSDVAHNRTGSKAGETEPSQQNSFPERESRKGGAKRAIGVTGTRQQYFRMCLAGSIWRRPHDSEESGLVGVR